MTRRIKPFSQRDRVQYRDVSVGTPFLWRGYRWVKVDGGCARLESGRAPTSVRQPDGSLRDAVARFSVSCTDSMADLMRRREEGFVHPFPGTRVTVSRASGLARRRQLVAAEKFSAVEGGDR